MQNKKRPLFKKNSWHHYLAIVTLAMAVPALAKTDTTPAQKDSNAIRILTLNTWHDRFDSRPNNHKPNDVRKLKDFLVNGNYDVLTFQELRQQFPSEYMTILPDLMQESGLGTYQTIQAGDSGVFSRLPGSMGKVDGLGVSTPYTQVNGTISRPDAVIGTVHLTYYDEPDGRVKQAKKLNEWAKESQAPIILTGDFNAGDVSERGLHSAEKQAFFLKEYAKGQQKNQYWYQLLTEYAQDKAALDAYLLSMKNQSNNTIANSTIPDGLFKDETYPIAGNTPKTMNVLKKQFQMLSNAHERESFTPHEAGNGVVTWPSQGEDQTEAWGSWHRTQIDHFLASRPYAKWWALEDNPDDTYLGILEETAYVTNEDGSKTALSDHAPVAHNVAWKGPIIEEYQQNNQEKLRMVWNKNAATFTSDNTVFELSRNNMRDDVYLGQIADDNGNPILTWLSEEEKKQKLNCASSDTRLSQAIAEYCIDDHRFISETLVADNGTVAITEDAALGGSQAKLRLDNGHLRIDGTQMNVLNREVVLEGNKASSIIVSDINNKVGVNQAISGTGGLIKDGQGLLALSGDNTYTGPTEVRAGELSINGSVQSDILVGNQATLSGNAKIGSLTIADGGHLAIGQSIGQMTATGDVHFNQGSHFDVELNTQGEADQLISEKNIFIAGGSLNLSLENQKNLLSMDEAQSLSGKSFNILAAQNGISGQFDFIKPDYLFLNTQLNQNGKVLSVNIDRNDVALEQAAANPDQVSIAKAINQLGSGNAVYESVITLKNQKAAQQAYQELNGQIHADVARAQLAMGQEWRDNINNRLRETQSQDISTGIWGQATGGWSSSKNQNGITGYDTTSKGFLLGLDHAFKNQMNIGIATGYNRFNIDSNRQAKANSDNIHLALYAGKRWNKLNLRGGVMQSWQNIDTERTIAYDQHFAKHQVKYKGQTQQAFAELSYPVQLASSTLSAFANLSYSHFKTEAFVEDGKASALASKKQDHESTQSQLGLRWQKEWPLQAQNSIQLNSELAWLHELGNKERQSQLHFSDGNALFTTHALNASENAAAIKMGTTWQLQKNSKLSLSYSGLIANKENHNRVDAKFSWHF